MNTPQGQLQAIKEMRSKIIAPVDLMGCDRLASACSDPATKRFQTLIALMLSSQTRDKPTAQAHKALFSSFPTCSSLATATPSQIESLIKPVGFHRVKAVNISKVAQICLQPPLCGDIPRSLEKLQQLPGVGPKMAHLTMTCAWDDCQGIGVDVHVHRISRRLGWTKSPTPEGCRRDLERIFERALWPEINPLLVGFGQEICGAAAGKGREIDDSSSKEQSKRVRSKWPKCEICTLEDVCEYGRGRQRRMKEKAEEQD